MVGMGDRWPYLDTVVVDSETVIIGLLRKIRFCVFLYFLDEKTGRDRNVFDLERLRLFQIFGPFENLVVDITWNGSEAVLKDRSFHGSFSGRHYEK